jgi:hypothetical protein
MKRQEALFRGGGDSNAAVHPLLRTTSGETSSTRLPTPEQQLIRLAVETSCAPVQDTTGCSASAGSALGNAVNDQGASGRSASTIGTTRDGALLT